MIKLKDYTNGKKPKYFLINEDCLSESFVYATKQQMIDDIDTYKHLKNYQNGKLEDLKKDYTIVDWKIKEGNTRIRKD
tara:strand:- start:127 stop:360 length:234 start_codon:yes stop_codon:yes gene_type:complete